MTRLTRSRPCVTEDPPRYGDPVSMKTALERNQVVKLVSGHSPNLEELV